MSGATPVVLPPSSHAKPVDREEVAGRRRKARTVGRRLQTVWASGVEEPLPVTLVLPRLAREHMVSKYRTENCGSLCLRDE